jgi:hypothetical protein
VRWQKHSWLGSDWTAVNKFQIFGRACCCCLCEIIF